MTEPTTDARFFWGHPSATPGFASTRAPLPDRSGHIDALAGEQLGEVTTKGAMHGYIAIFNAKPEPREAGPKFRVVQNAHSRIHHECFFAGIGDPDRAGVEERQGERTERDVVFNVERQGDVQPMGHGGKLRGEAR